jgi:hypothetical protein
VGDEVGDGDGVTVEVWLGVTVGPNEAIFGSDIDVRSQPMLIKATIRKIDIQRLFMSYFRFFLKW